MKTSLSDKIAVLLAWVLVHTALGSLFVDISTACDNWIEMMSLYGLYLFISYKWSYKMIGEAKRVLGFED